MNSENVVRNRQNICFKMLGLLHADFRAIARSFDKSRKLMILQQNPNTTCILKFSYTFLCRVLQKI